MFHDFCWIPPGRYPAKIVKRPFWEEIGFEALRTDVVVLLLPIPAKNRCGIFGSGTPERKCRNILPERRRRVFFASFACFCSNSELAQISEDKW